MLNVIKEENEDNFSRQQQGNALSSSNLINLNKIINKEAHNNLIISNDLSEIKKSSNTKINKESDKNLQINVFCNDYKPQIKNNLINKNHNNNLKHFYSSEINDNQLKLLPAFNKFNRTDIKGNKIERGGKHKIAFIDQVDVGKDIADIIDIECFKEYNKSFEECVDMKKNINLGCCYIF